MQQKQNKKTRREFMQQTASAAVSRSCALEGKKVFAEQKENWQ